MAPTTGLYVPAGQGVAFSEKGGQKEPAGHNTGVPEAQKWDAGQGPQVTWRTRLLDASATTISPLALTATPVGQLNEAPVPAPSENPTTLPASVLTTPPGVTLQMRLLPESATMTFPPASTATPQGLAKEAAAPVPSANANKPLPASVLTVPLGVTLRMRWLLWSATNTTPLESTATPTG